MNQPVKGRGVMTEIVKVREQLQISLSDFQEQASLQSGQIFVVGCSTSEVLGEKNWDIRNDGSSRGDFF